ncbi:hypothetical protein P9112_008230 [Eukaryota sp. TZLM1-RC]
MIDYLKCSSSLSCYQESKLIWYKVRHFQYKFSKLEDPSIQLISTFNQLVSFAMMEPILDMDSLDVYTFFEVLKPPFRNSKGNHVHGRYKCFLCSHTLTCSKTRLVQHITGSSKNVKPCAAPPPKLKSHLESIASTKVQIQQHSHNKESLKHTTSPPDESLPPTSISSSSSTISLQPPTKRSNNNDVDVEITRKDVESLQNHANQCILKFFIKHGLSFDLMYSEEFNQMMSSIAACGNKFKTCYFEDEEVSLTAMDGIIDQEISQ